MIVFKVNRNSRSFTVKRIQRKITVNRVGKPGKTGKAATIQVGSTTTLTAGSSATVANTGTDSDAVFNFGIPQGQKGDPGDPATNLVTSVNGRQGAVTGLAEKAELDMVENELYQDLTEGDAATLASANQYTDDQIDGLTFVESVQAGTNVTVDNTDPKNPVVSATGTTSISFDNVTDKPLAPAYNGLLVNNASDEEFPADQAEYSIQPDPMTFAYRGESGTVKGAPATELDDLVQKIQLDMLEEELFTDITTGLAGKVSILPGNNILYSKNSTGVHTGLTYSAAENANTVPQRSSTGQITATDPTANNHLTTKLYVDNADTALQTQINDKASNAALTSGLALKVDRTSLANQIYGTDGNGLPVLWSRGQATPAGNSIGQRTSAGTLKAATATESNDLVPLAQLNTSLGNYLPLAGGTVTGNLIVTTSVASTTAFAVTNPAGAPLFTMDNTAGNEIVMINTVPRGDSVRNLGKTSAYWANVFTRQVNLNGTLQLTGTGFPNGVVSAPVGSTYTDTAATNGAIEWKKATGTGNTGWVVNYGESTSRQTSFSSGTGYIEYRRVGNVIFYALGGTLGASITNPVANIPAGFRPRVAYSFLYGNGGAPYSKIATVLTNGDVSLFSSPTPSTTLAGSGNTPVELNWPTT